MEYDEQGRELPDPTPVAMPTGVGRPESLTDTIRRLVRNEISQAAQAYEQESFQEANDFDNEEDDFLSPYEVIEMMPEGPSDEGEDTAYNKGTDDNDRVSASERVKDPDGRPAPTAKNGVPISPDKPSGQNEGN